MGGTLFWTAVCVAGVALLAPALPTVEDRPVPSPPPSPEALSDAGPGDGRDRDSSGGASKRLERHSDGHFYAEARVNGARIRFLVDTGASVVALTPRDARAAGIQAGPERTMARGAGGAVEIVPVTIDHLALGPIEANDVSAAIAETLPISLLGQSFLSRADSVEIRGDELRLR
ncbi:TIGR02281 family clan AA aspartic protease [Sphingosinicella sp. CPCC 101087]|uniref:retropepsin-like aspartic protease family protein n=1 Tax=Sphingosinicella sp. CPCC 101087 TaxID=2497754 RepID=UPI00197F21C1|nr:TIGR02281 family clan AA aspartic protease [Sphingosinicella sp. CPCC 101087]